VMMDQLSQFLQRQVSVFDHENLLLNLYFPNLNKQRHLRDRVEKNQTWIISNSFRCHINCSHCWCWKVLNFLIMYSSIRFNRWIFLYKIILFFINIKILCNIPMNICFNIFCYTTCCCLRNNSNGMKTKSIHKN
jgi:hypothetical protein